MRVLLVGFAFVLIALAFIPMSRAARADAQTHVFQVSCLPEIKLFEIRDIGVFDEPKGVVTGPSYDLTDKGYALYAPAWAFYQLDKPPDERDDPLVDSPTGFECRLGAYTLELLVTPIPSSRYRDAVWDILVSLSIAGRWVFDNVPFEPCDNRGPITRLAFEGDQHAITLEGRFGGVWPDKVSPNDAWNNRFRRFDLKGYSLDDWVAAMLSRETPHIPLGPKAIDYFQDASSDTHGVPISDCYPYRFEDLQRRP